VKSMERAGDISKMLSVLRLIILFAKPGIAMVAFKKKFDGFGPNVN